MIVLADVRPDRVTTYHTEPRIAGIAAKTSRIRARQEYIDLKASIAERGFLDPVVAHCAPGRPCLVEVGEQRVLIARDMGVRSIRAVIYDKGLKFPYAYARRLTTMEEVKALFGTGSGALGLGMLRRYVAAGIATF